MSSWIKLIDPSASRIEKRSNRNKRSSHRDFVPFVPAIIEDDSSDENCDLNSTISAKRKRVMPLENLTIENEQDSSDDCGEVEYDPDGTVLPRTEAKKFKTTLPIVQSTPAINQPSTSHCASNSKSNSWITWTTMTNEQMNLSFRIEDSNSDSNESSTHTLIDESSDSSLMQSSTVEEQETVIETQESITPPIAPFIAPSTDKHPKERKVRMKKGGLVERLKKSLSQAKSNVLFWQHHRSADLIPPGVLVTVNRVENTYGRILIHTNVSGEPTIFSLCSRSGDVGEGDVIEVEFDSEFGYKTDNYALYSYVDKVTLVKKYISS